MEGEVVIMTVIYNRYEKRCEILASYLLETQGTVREAAAKFGISKSTVHKDITERLKIENRAMYDMIRILLDKNKSERHLRGAEATKRKYGTETPNYTK